MFQFHSIPLLTHLRSPHRRAMSTTSVPPPTSDGASTEPPTAPFRFLDLPLELREQIYALYFKPADRLHKSATLERDGFYGGVYEFDLRVMRTSKEVCREARKVWRREVKTVKVGTPWPSTGMYFFDSELWTRRCS
jgi:hypothetical protein